MLVKQVIFFLLAILIMNIAPEAHADISDTERAALLKALSAKGDDYKPRTRHLNADGSPIYINRLILENSPYLLQHAHNPVNWYAWGPAAFAAAKAQNKPIFLSIGYSTCHWCHVMEHESFEDLAVAKILNRQFIAIKVDRERRPDIDSTYMTAVQMIAGRGGWPMSSFLTPDGKPFFGGTYFPKENFISLLTRVDDAWHLNESELRDQAGKVAAAVRQHESNVGEAALLDAKVYATATKNLMASYDDMQGGFGQAPKFPHESTLLFLFDDYLRTGDKNVLQAVDFTLDKMAMGGLLDQIGGGFHRYSTDPQWLVPHFEKMLYNQAQLVQAYLLAYRLTGKASHQRVAVLSLDYVLREMQAPKGGFYSAGDADSEGEEGLFFIWKEAEIEALLPASQAKLAIEFYGLSEGTNFEGQNILFRPLLEEAYAEANKLPLKTLLADLDKIRAILLTARSKRIAPEVDKKILASWNGMMIKALVLGASTLGDKRYLTAAERAANRLWKRNFGVKDGLLRVLLDDHASIPAILDDYAHLADAMISLLDETGDAIWLQRAQKLVQTMTDKLWDEGNSGFYMGTLAADTPNFSRPREIADGALESGNAVALRVLARLARRVDDPKFSKQATASVATFSGAVKQSPSIYAAFLQAQRSIAEGELDRYAYLANGHIKAGVSSHPKRPTQLMLRLDIDTDWHANSHTPAQAQYRATAIALFTPGEAKAVDAKIEYPDGELVRTEFEDRPLSLYQGRTEFKLTLPEKYVRQPLLLKITLQACDVRSCLAPESARVFVPVGL